MFPMKKPLLLLFFFGPISLSFCDQERDADEEEGSENGAEDKKLNRVVKCSYRLGSPDSRCN
uniref:Odorranain-A-RA1 peptide n=1 Tax=Odorrana andersonii TaxID=369514 RepID=E3SZ93_ODOAN|nr:odorranain-A-RA1 peptide precursor [Odorrana andersonii]